jgi:Putative NAD(P)-binding
VLICGAAFDAQHAVAEEAGSAPRGRANRAEPSWIASSRGTSSRGAEADWHVASLGPALPAACGWKAAWPWWSVPAASRCARVAGLRAAGARVLVVAPDLSPSLSDLAAGGLIAVRERGYLATVLEGARLALACTDQPEVNAAVAADAEWQRIWCVRYGTGPLLVRPLPDVLCVAGSDAEGPAVPHQRRQLGRGRGIHGHEAIPGRRQVPVQRLRGARGALG